LQIYIRLALCFLSLVCAYGQKVDWPTDGGNAQRTNWQENEHILTKENVKNLKILWKLKLNNVPREMHSLFPPLIIGNLNTPEGTKEVAIEAGVNDNLYAIDVQEGRILWQKHFDFVPAREGRGIPLGDPLCPGGQTATPIVAPADSSGRRTVYALSGDGRVHSINAADGQETDQPFKLSFVNGKAYALNLWHSILVTTTSQSCNGSPNQAWAVDLNDPAKRVMTYNPRSGGLWGRQGAAIDSTGTMWAPTGDGIYDPENRTFGNGLVGFRAEDQKLELSDWFEPRNWSWLRKRDLDMQVTPAVFKYQDRELMATGSKECRVYLLDTREAGGDDHQTPLAQSALMCNDEINFASAGIWGSMATWNDSSTRWILTPFWGPVSKNFQVPQSYGPVTHGAVVAFKLKSGSDGTFELEPGWMSRDMSRAEPPVVANGVVFAYGSGENTEQAYAHRGLYDFSFERIKNSTHATLYALDAETGKELFSSGEQITSFNHFSGLSVANGRVYIGTYDSVLYCFGLPGEK
jgi:outer membrane protein assembly factor BamB